MASTTSSLSNSNDLTPRWLRLRKANRNDVVPVPARLEDLLPQNHLACLIWEAVGRLDLSAFYAPIKVVEGEPGAPAIDPKILVALWLYAISQGVTSAREIDVLRVEHLAYIWICGGVSLKYHTISDFRTDYEEELDELMTEVVEQMDQAGLVESSTQAQDGMRVRASAGAASFRRQPTLEKALEQAQAQKVEVEWMGQAESDERTAAQKAARERAASERVERLEAALAEMPAARAAKKPKERDKARVSSTDPEARVMKPVLSEAEGLADGGYRPAYNWQFSVELSNFVITGMEVVNTGSDKAFGYEPSANKLSGAAKTDIVIGQGHGASTPLRGAHQFLVAEPTTTPYHPILLPEIGRLVVTPRIGLEPISRPLSNIPSHVHDPIRTGSVWETAHNDGPPVTRLLGVRFSHIPLVPPGIDACIRAPSRLLPLSLGRQPLPKPFTIGLGIVPTYLHHRMLGLALCVDPPRHAVTLLLRIGNIVGLLHEPCKLLVGHLEHVNLKSSHKDHMSRPFVLNIATHSELASGDSHHWGLHLCWRGLCRYSRQLNRRHGSCFCW